jgi:predicted metal-dependent phosphoesterase TrpH
MAHPKYWKNEWKTGGVDFALARKELSRLKEAGLDGVESLYQANTQEENEGFTRIAMGLGLLMSAGSDFHGLRKPGITLGMEVGENFIAPLLERL